MQPQGFTWFAREKHVQGVKVSPIGTYVKRVVFRNIKLPKHTMEHHSQLQIRNLPNCVAMHPNRHHFVFVRRII